jgi:hypothetical protein
MIYGTLIDHGYTNDTSDPEAAFSQKKGILIITETNDPSGNKFLKLSFNQTNNNPTPFYFRSGIPCVTYVPFTDEGIAVLSLIKDCYIKRNYFAHDMHGNVKFGGGVHKKTQMQGKSQEHGFPDEGWYERVVAEFARIGTSFEVMSKYPSMKSSHPQSLLANHRYYVISSPYIKEIATVFNYVLTTANRVNPSHHQQYKNFIKTKAVSPGNRDTYKETALKKKQPIGRATYYDLFGNKVSHNTTPHNPINSNDVNEMKITLGYLTMMLNANVAHYFFDKDMFNKFSYQKFKKIELINMLADALVQSSYTMQHFNEVVFLFAFIKAKIYEKNILKFLNDESYISAFKTHLKLPAGAQLSIFHYSNIETTLRDVVQVMKLLNITAIDVLFKNLEVINYINSDSEWGPRFKKIYVRNTAKASKDEHDTFKTFITKANSVSSVPNILPSDKNKMNSMKKHFKTVIDYNVKDNIIEIQRDYKKRLYKVCPSCETYVTNYIRFALNNIVPHNSTDVTNLLQGTDVKVNTQPWNPALLKHNDEDDYRKYFGHLQKIIYHAPLPSITADAYLYRGLTYLPTTERHLLQHFPHSWSNGIITPLIFAQHSEGVHCILRIKITNELKMLMLGTHARELVSKNKLNESVSENFMDDGSKQQQFEVLLPGCIFKLGVKSNILQGILKNDARTMMSLKNAEAVLLQDRYSLHGITMIDVTVDKYLTYSYVKKSNFINRVNVTIGTPQHILQPEKINLRKIPK